MKKVKTPVKAKSKHATLRTLERKMDLLFEMQLHLANKLLTQPEMYEMMDALKAINAGELTGAEEAEDVVVQHQQ